MNADPIARLYRFLEYVTFGPLLWRTRTHHLPHLTQALQILILGEGDGRFLERLLDVNPTAQVDCYDTSSRMLQLASARTTNHHHRVHFHQADITTAPLPANHYDAIVANFIFDCFNDLQLTSLIHHLNHSAQPNCLWLVSDFAIPTSPIPRLASQLLTRFLYLCFRLTTGLQTRHLPNYASALTQAGLTLANHHKHAAGLLSSQLWLQP